MTPRLLLISLLALLLAACDIPGLGPDPRVAQREAEGKAIGGACRYAVRGIEECYQLNPKAPKTAIFDGWREMDQYMRENKLEGQPPTEDSRETAASGSEKGTDKNTEKSVDKTQDKGSDKKPAAPSGKKPAAGTSHPETANPASAGRPDLSRI